VLDILVITLVAGWAVVGTVSLALLLWLRFL
jgi:hypothetical protein